MSFHFMNLDAKVRQRMLDEVSLDESNGALFRGKFTNAAGKAAFPNLLKQAIGSGNEVTLAQSLHSGLFLESYEKRTPSGKTTMAKVPYNANEMLAEGEFNRFYIRAVCRVAIEQDIAHVTIYRAKHVENPRSESLQRIGQSVVAQKLLNDLRANQGVDTALGCPSGPNSGLSIKLPASGKP